MELLGLSVPNFVAEKQDEISGETISVRVSFVRKNVDTLVEIEIKQLHRNLANHKKIHDEIESRLRAAFIPK